MDPGKTSKMCMYSTVKDNGCGRQAPVDSCREENRDVLAGERRDKAAVLRGATANTRQCDDK